MSGQRDWTVLLDIDSSAGPSFLDDVLESALLHYPHITLGLISTEPPRPDVLERVGRLKCAKQILGWWTYAPVENQSSWWTLLLSSSSWWEAIQKRPACGVQFRRWNTLGEFSLGLLKVYDPEVTWIHCHRHSASELRWDTCAAWFSPRFLKFLLRSPFQPCSRPEWEFISVVHSDTVSPRRTRVFPLPRASPPVSKILQRPPSYSATGMNARIREWAALRQGGAATQVREKARLWFVHEFWKTSPYDRRHALEQWISAAAETEDLQGMMDGLLCFEWCHVDHELLQLHDQVWLPIAARLANWEVRGTMDVERRPNLTRREFVVQVGHSPHGISNLLCSNPMRREALTAYPRMPPRIGPPGGCRDQVQRLGRWECGWAWAKVSGIYVLNLDRDVDRWVETVRELGRLHAPFDRIVRQPAPTPNPKPFKAENEKKEPATYVLQTEACLRGQMAMLEHFLARTDNGVGLFLEDDFSLGNGSLEKMKGNLHHIVDRLHDPSTPVDIGLLAASKYHQIQPWDEVVSLSWQDCTTCSAYLLTRASAVRVLAVWQKALIELRKTHDTNRFACDRAWACLQPFWVLRDKFACQRPTASAMTNIVANFD